MKDFMLLMRGNGSQQSPAEMQKKLMEYMGWMEKWKTKGQYVEGFPFKGEGAFLKNEHEIVTEGDFLDPVAGIGGFVWIKAEDLENAIEIAKECPLIQGCGIYVRPFLKM